MQFLTTVLFTVQILTALAMIGLILIQHGKGADMGAAFGSGSSGSLFGASGGANFLSRTTAVLATVFFVATLGLAYTSGIRPAGSGSVLENAPVTAPVQSSGAVPTPAAPAASGVQAIPTSPSAVPSTATQAVPSTAQGSVTK